MDMKSESSPAVHINLNVRGMGVSATIAINKRCGELQKEGHDIYRLGLGQSPFPVPELVANSLREHAHQKDYLAVKGLPALRESIVGYYQRTQGLQYSPENILVGPGSKELMFLLQLTYYGDLVIPSPSWVSYAPQARIIGRKLHWLTTELETGLGVTAEVLESICRNDPDLPRLLILNYPGNPTGITYSNSQLEAIAKVARRYRILLLADEIYGGLTFNGEHTSIARYYPEGTIISNGLSKWCGAGGWRLGAFIFPESLTWLLDAMAVVASETFTSTSAPIQYAAVSAFSENAELEIYLKNCRAVMGGLCHSAWKRLINIGADVIQPMGGFYLFPNFEPLREQLVKKGIVDGKQFCERLLEATGVACLPGYEFGRPDAELSMRIACVDFNGAEALAAAGDTSKIDEAFLRNHCTRVMKAIDLLCEFVTEK
jgi:aspartate aminotransferase